MEKDILTQKSYLEYFYRSRYLNDPYYYHNIDEKYIYGTTKQLNKDTTYVLYKTKSGDTYDSISLEFYNNPTYYWVICDFNNILDCFSEIEIGTELKIPTLNSITFNMES